MVCAWSGPGRVRSYFQGKAVLWKVECRWSLVPVSGPVWGGYGPSCAWSIVPGPLSLVPGPGYGMVRVRLYHYIRV